MLPVGPRGPQKYSDCSPSGQKRSEGRDWYSGDRGRAHGLCPRGRARSLELDRDLWILYRGPSARQQSLGPSFSSSPLTECGENEDRERL